MNRFIATKKLEGRSDKTLKYYGNTVNKMLIAIDKNVKAITTDDLERILQIIKVERLLVNKA